LTWDFVGTLAKRMGTSDRPRRILGPDALGSALDDLLQGLVGGEALQGEAESLRYERHQLRDLAQSLQRDLANVHRSWALKVGKLLVRPGTLLEKMIRHDTAGY
jgi:hypothetical protein